MGNKINKILNEKYFSGMFRRFVVFTNSLYLIRSHLTETCINKKYYKILNKNAK